MSQDSIVGAGGVVSNDERNRRRWRLGQLGHVAEASLWMLVMNAVAHEEGGDGTTQFPPVAERRRVHEEIQEVFEVRLDQHARIWEALVCGSVGFCQATLMQTWRTAAVVCSRKLRWMWI